MKLGNEVKNSPFKKPIGVVFFCSHRGAHDDTLCARICLRRGPPRTRGHLPCTRPSTRGCTGPRAPQGAHDGADLLTARPLHARLHGPPLACAAAGRVCHSRFCAPPEAPAAARHARPSVPQRPRPREGARARGTRGPREGGKRAPQGPREEAAPASPPHRRALAWVRGREGGIGVGDGRGVCARWIR